LQKTKHSITRDKDRGKDFQSVLWFKLFQNELINGHHLKLAEKKAAKDKK
jgi:hypothetical protein